MQELMRNSISEAGRNLDGVVPTKNFYLGRCHDFTMLIDTDDDFSGELMAMESFAKDAEMTIFTTVLMGLDEDEIYSVRNYATYEGVGFDKETCSFSGSRSPIDLVDWETAYFA